MSFIYCKLVTCICRVVLIGTTVINENVLSSLLFLCQASPLKLLPYDRPCDAEWWEACMPINLQKYNVQNPFSFIPTRRGQKESQAIA